MPGTLTRWEPFAELGELRHRFDRMFDEWLDGRERAWTPAVDVVRENGHLVVRADIPGIKPEEVKIEVEDDILTVSGEHDGEQGGEGQALRAARAPLRVLLTLDGAARGRRSQEDRGQDARRRRRSDDPAPQGGKEGDDRDYADRRLMAFGAEGRLELNNGPAGPKRGPFPPIGAPSQLVADSAQ